MLTNRRSVAAELPGASARSFRTIFGNLPETNDRITATKTLSCGLDASRNGKIQLRALLKLRHPHESSCRIRGQIQRSDHARTSGVPSQEGRRKTLIQLPRGKPLLILNQVSIQAFADRSLTYAILLSKLPHALCARFHQVLDLQKMRCIIVALYVCLLQSLTASLHKLLCKVVELTLPTTLKKCPRQDHVLGALAIMDRVTQMLTDLHLDESCRMVSLLQSTAIESTDHASFLF